MQLYITNSLSNKLEFFTPADNKNIKMYVCGPTVYDYPHIGNARSVVVYDLLYRLLKAIYGEACVTYVRNITDIDDKINIRAKELNISIKELTTKTIIDFHNDMDYLNCLRPNFEPKATEHISSIIALITRLINNGCAYEANGHIYFEVSKSKDYGKLAGRKLDELIVGSRIDIDPHKKHPADFVLWKPASKDDDVSAIFDSPWGQGRPGWHIECSAMCHYHLGSDFDIHGGGADLIFPHHTNEVAQSCGAYPESHFAKYWIHNGFLTVGGDKMSKSLGNFITVNELKNKQIKGEVIRHLLLKTHYRSPLDFNDKALHDSAEFMDYCYRALERAEITTAKGEIDLNNLPEKFLSTLLNDLNSSAAFSFIHELAHLINKAHGQADKTHLGQVLYNCGQLLGLFNQTPAEWFGITKDEAIEALIAQRMEAKLTKNWAKADEIRAELQARGIIIEDKADGSTIWRRGLQL